MSPRRQAQSYTYSTGAWGDLFTGVGGNTIEYDEIGNPIKIGVYNESDAQVAIVWVAGNDATGFGVGDDGILPTLIGALAKGVKLVAG